MVVSGFYRTIREFSERRRLIGEVGEALRDLGKGRLDINYKFTNDQFSTFLERFRKMDRDSDYYSSLVGVRRNLPDEYVVASVIGSEPSDYEVKPDTFSISWAGFTWLKDNGHAGESINHSYSCCG